MPEGTAPPPQGSPPEVGGGGEVGEDIVLHTDPVRIPLTALPQSIIPRPAGSRFATTFIAGTIAAPWITGALITGHPLARWFALGWGLLLAVAFIADMRRATRVH